MLATHEAGGGGKGVVAHHLAERGQRRPGAVGENDGLPVAPPPRPQLGAVVLDLDRGEQEPVPRQLKPGVTARRFEDTRYGSGRPGVHDARSRNAHDLALGSCLRSAARLEFRSLWILLFFSRIALCRSQWYLSSGTISLHPR
jgi:hypothetical protein